MVEQRPCGRTNQHKHGSIPEAGGSPGGVSREAKGDWNVAMIILYKFLFSHLLRVQSGDEVFVRVSKQAHFPLCGPGRRSMVASLHTEGLSCAKAQGQGELSF